MADPTGRPGSICYPALGSSVALGVNPTPTYHPTQLSRLALPYHAAQPPLLPYPALPCEIALPAVSQATLPCGQRASGGGLRLPAASQVSLPCGERGSGGGGAVQPVMTAWLDCPALAQTAADNRDEVQDRKVQASGSCRKGR
jgi:hypothetical protein